MDSRSTFNVKMCHSATREAAVKDKHTHAQSLTDTWTYLNVGLFFTYCVFSATQNDMLLKTSTLRGPRNTSHTHTKNICAVDRYWWRRSQDFSSSCFAERSQMPKRLRPPNLDRLGSDRKWHHSHKSRSPDADKALLPGKVKHGERQSTLLSSPFLLSTCLIKTGVSTMESYSDICHWDRKLHINIAETRCKNLDLLQEQDTVHERSMLIKLFPTVLNENNVWNVKLMTTSFENK